MKPSVLVEIDNAAWARLTPRMRWRARNLYRIRRQGGASRDQARVDLRFFVAGMEAALSSLKWESSLAVS
ncbi:MAG: hypothetical protein FWC87_01040 [Acidimicrobiaceae bacterium]|nr:hypothetical protein [Acidimicrobiaceae bacterium]